MGTCRKLHFMAGSGRTGFGIELWQIAVFPVSAHQLYGRYNKLGDLSRVPVAPRHCPFREESAAQKDEMHRENLLDKIYHSVVHIIIKWWGWTRMRLASLLVLALVLDVAGVVVIFVMSARAGLRNRGRAAAREELMKGTESHGALSGLEPG